MRSSVKFAAVVAASLGAVLIAPLTASASEVVFISRATESHATFVTDTGGFTVQVEIDSVENIGISKGAPVDDLRTLVFVNVTNDFSQAQDFLIGSTSDSATVAPNLNTATWGPETVNLTSFGPTCCTPQPVTLQATWTATGPADHNHMLLFFCPPGTCFGMFNLVGTHQPASVSFGLSGTIDNIDLSQATWTQTVGEINRSTGTGVFG